MWFHKCPEPPKPEVTAEHVAALHDHIEQSTNRITDHFPQLMVVPDKIATHLFELTAALRAYEVSHRTTQTHTVNGFEKTEVKLCDCDNCQGARAALG